MTELLGKCNNNVRTETANIRLKRFGNVSENATYHRRHITKQTQHCGKWLYCSDAQRSHLLLRFLSCGFFRRSSAEKKIGENNRSSSHRMNFFLQKKAMYAIHLEQKIFNTIAIFSYWLWANNALKETATINTKITTNIAPRDSYTYAADSKIQKLGLQVQHIHQMIDDKICSMKACQFFSVKITNYM